MCPHIQEFHHIITSSHFISLISSPYSSPLTPYSNKRYIVIFHINYFQQHCEKHCRIQREKDLTELTPTRLYIITLYIATLQKHFFLVQYPQNHGFYLIKTSCHFILTTSELYSIIISLYSFLLCR